MSIENRLENVENRVTELEKKTELNELKSRISTHVGFMTIYFDNLSKHKNCKQCYEAIEDIHHDMHGDFKYISYESFRVLLAKHRKNGLL